MHGAGEESALRTLERSKPPFLLKYRSSKGLILTTVCLALFTDGFLYGVLVPVIPFSLIERSGIPEDEVQYWTSTLLAAFGAATFVGSPICGWIADHTASRRSPLLIGLFVVAGATVMFCFGKSVYILLVSRILQGFSAGIVYTVGLALLVDTVGKKEIGQMMGFALSSANVGVLIAPLLGGIVYANAGYYAVFVMMLGLVLIDILLRLVMIEKKIAAKWEWKEENYDGSDSFPHDDANAHLKKSKNAAPTRQSDLEDSSASEDAERPHLIKRDSRPDNSWHLPPVITLLKSPRLDAAIYGVFVTVSLISSFDSVLPLFVKRNFHWDSTGAGLIFLCIGLPPLSGPLVGWASDRLGRRWIAVAGLLLSSAFFVLLRFVTDDSMEHIVLLCVLLALIGFALTCSMSPLASDLSFVVEELERESPGLFGEAGAYAQAYALFNCAMAAATIVGPVWAGYAYESLGWTTMSWTLAVFSASGAVPVVLFTGGSIVKSR